MKGLSSAGSQSPDGTRAYDSTWSTRKVQACRQQWGGQGWGCREASQPPQGPVGKGCTPTAQHRVRGQSPGGQVEVGASRACLQLLYACWKVRGCRPPAGAGGELWDADAEEQTGAARGEGVSALTGSRSEHETALAEDTTKCQETLGQQTEQGHRPAHCQGPRGAGTASPGS